MGNIDIKQLKAGDGVRRVYKVASYISKYLTKDSVVRFNKKRYWASRVNLPEVRRYWLKSRNLGEAMLEAFKRLNFKFESPRLMFGSTITRELFGFRRCLALAPLIHLLRGNFMQERFFGMYAKGQKHWQSLASTTDDGVTTFFVNEVSGEGS